MSVQTQANCGPWDQCGQKLLTKICSPRGGAGQNGTATKLHGRQNDTVRHFGTEGHFGTATK